MTDSLLPPATLGAGTSRRTVLRAVSVSGAAAVLLAACGGGGDTAGSGTGDTSAPADGKSPTADDESPAATGGGGLVATADVPVGSGVILEAEKVVVTQPTEGTFKAFSSICTHQSCPVTGVKADKISCSCHGSSFSTKDGSVLGGPASRPLKEIPVTVEGDQVVQS